MSPMPINHPVLVFARRAGDFLFSPVGLAAVSYTHLTLPTKA